VQLLALRVRMRFSWFVHMISDARVTAGEEPKKKKVSKKKQARETEATAQASMDVD
jgi:hypothetical protein